MTPLTGRMATSVVVLLLTAVLALAGAQDDSLGTVHIQAVTTGTPSGNEVCPCCPRSSIDAVCLVDTPPQAALPDPCPSPRTVGVLAQPFAIPDSGWNRSAELVFDPVKGFSAFGAKRTGTIVNAVDEKSITFVADPTGDSSSVVARVTYPAGLYASNSGVNFNAFPYQGLDAIGDEARLQYKVWFAPDFDWVHGGKLPGFYGGDVAGSLGCSGGSYQEGCWSLRTMWREGGRGELYAYFPPSQQTCELSGAPGVNLACEGTANGTCFGTRVGSSYWAFPRAAWTTVDVYVRMNTLGQQDGAIAAAINGTTTLYYDKIVWRTAADQTVNTVFFSTFFGGGSLHEAPNSTQTAILKDFKVWGNAQAKGSSSGAAASAAAPEPAALSSGGAGAAVSSQSLRGGGF